jgi:hypothetical protein
MGILALRGIIRGKSLLAGGKSIFVLMKKERERELKTIQGSRN